MRSLAALAVLVFASGCGGGVEPPPKTVKVEGTVNHKGQPLEAGKVILYPSAPPADGKPVRPTVGDVKGGKFTLSTFVAGDGAMPGDYKVSVESMDKEVTMEEFNEGKRQKSLIPKKYSAMQTSGLTAKIPDQAEPFQLTLELKD